jgi:hypothetical protein
MNKNIFQFSYTEIIFFHFYLFFVSSTVNIKLKTIKYYKLVLLFILIFDLCLYISLYILNIHFSRKCEGSISATLDFDTILDVFFLFQEIDNSSIYSIYLLLKMQLKS